MSPYYLPVLSLALLVVALVLCVRSLLTRLFYLWIIPTLLTLGLIVFTLLVLLPMVSNATVNFGLSGDPLVLYIADLLWLVMLILFRVRLFSDSVTRSRINRSEYAYIRPRKSRKDNQNGPGSLNRTDPPFEQL